MIADVRNDRPSRPLDRLRGRLAGTLARAAARPPTRRPAHRSHWTLALAAVVGVLAGGAVTVFDWLASSGVEAVLGLPPALQAGAPLVGLALGAVALQRLGDGATSATADEYIHNFHEPTRSLPLRAVPGRVVAALATLGFGGALGYEGPSMYMGSAIGAALQRRLGRLGRYFGPDDTKVLMVAGAAAGVAAIFKAPVTGLVFALEVPYREDLARRMLLPAGIAAAAGYVVFALFAGTDPLLPVSGHAPFDLRDIGGAALIGLVAGTLARGVAGAFTTAKTLSRTGRPALRVAAAGAVLAALFVVGRCLGVANPTLGPGYDTLRWALAPGRAMPVLLALALLRVAATVATLAGGGTGGVFIPLVLQGALLGQVAGDLLDPTNPTLFPVVGIAAFLGAGYRVPLAGVVFVAEVTGRPGFIVPGLVAAMVAQLTMGPRSVSPYQAVSRPGHLERRLALPIAQVVDTATATVPPDATVSELFWQHLVGGRQRAVAVVEGSRYVGLVGAEDLAGLNRDTWRATTVAQVARADVPTARLDQRVDDALRLMDRAGTDRVAVTDGDRFVGTLAVDDVVRLDDVLARAGVDAR
jgi:CIC family chloride channel protein